MIFAEGNVGDLLHSALASMFQLLRMVSILMAKSVSITMAVNKLLMKEMLHAGMSSPEPLIPACV
jgi:hypothetical protein